jgi:hypothetical protein
MIDLNTVSLLGIDVGYSKKRATTGIAWMLHGNVGAERTHTDAERRLSKIPKPQGGYRTIAIDGPLLPAGASENHRRRCEQLFANGAFQKRCKPGYSDIGNGKQLRSAAGTCAQQIQPLASRVPDFPEAQVVQDFNIVEAFPNAFLGVLVSENVYAARGWLKRGKFDWLYEHFVAHELIERIFNLLRWSNDDLRQRMKIETDHEKKAAFICLLTAIMAVSGKAAQIGDPQGGWFWLPPKELWASWAVEALENNVRKAGSAQRLFENSLRRGGWRGFREPERSVHWYVSTGSTESRVRHPQQ